MLKLCISGSTRSGKDFFALELEHALNERISDRYSIKAKRYSLAAEAKAQACSLYPERCEEFWAGDKSTEARQILCDMAEGRPDTFYTDFVLEQIKRDQPKVALITDGRFAVHFNELVKRNFTFVYIGDDTSQYDTALFFEAAKYKLPYRPSLNGFDVERFADKLLGI